MDHHHRAAELIALHKRLTEEGCTEMAKAVWAELQEAMAQIIRINERLRRG